MKISNKQLRRLIREVLITEQVVGYEAPSEEKEDGDDGGGYLDVGAMGIDTSKKSPDAKAASGQAVKSLTSDRQKDLDSGNIEDAETDAQELNTARKMRG